MKYDLYILILLSVFATSCNAPKDKQVMSVITEDAVAVQPQQTKPINPSGATILERFNPPEGFVRTLEDTASFAHYLRQLPLKPHGSEVLYYDGRIKPNRNIYAAVVDLPIGGRDLHQCADAVMRLQAEYLWKKKQWDKIHFNFTNGFRADYSRWRKGERIRVKGNQVSWTTGATPSDSYASFWKYLEMVFSYAGTLSLEKELDPVSVKDLQIGDVFIQGGSPGHAVLVVDLAKDPNTGKRVFLLAQSYMPAQEIQVLQNPSGDGPWYEAGFGEVLRTPEWVFEKGDLRRGKEL